MAVETHAAEHEGRHGPTADTAALSFETDRERFIRKLVIVLLGAEIAFVVLDWAVNYEEYVSSLELQILMNMAGEDSLHNYVSSLLSLAASVVLFLIYAHARQTGARRSLRLGWGFAAVFFLYVALDDGAAIHETVGTMLDSVFSFFPSYRWQVVYVPVLGIATLVVARFSWRNLQGRRLRWLALAAVVLWIAAVVLDYLDGRQDVYPPLADALGWGSYTVSHYARVIEELIEDVAGTLFLVTFLQHLLRTAPRISLTSR